MPSPPPLQPWATSHLLFCLYGFACSGHLRETESHTMRFSVTAFWAQCFPDSSMLWHAWVLCFSLWQNNIYCGDVPHFIIHSSVNGHLGSFTFWFFCEHWYIQFYVDMFSMQLCIYFRVELLGHFVTLTSKGLPDYFSYPEYSQLSITEAT